MVYSIVFNASLLAISLCAGLCALFRHTDFPKRMNDDEIEKYRIVAANHSKKVKGCAATAIVLGFVFYALIPALCIILDVETAIICICTALFAIVQISAIQIVFSAKSSRLSV